MITECGLICSIFTFKIEHLYSTRKITEERQSKATCRQAPLAMKSNLWSMYKNVSNEFSLKPEFFPDSMHELSLVLVRKFCFFFFFLIGAHA